MDSNIQVQLKQVSSKLSSIAKTSNNKDLSRLSAELIQTPSTQKDTLKIILDRISSILTTQSIQLDDTVTDLLIKLYNNISPPPIVGCKSPLEGLKTKFSDLAGLTKVKEELMTGYIYPSKFKGLFPQPTKGLLLYGPPGSGKTSIAKAVAGQFEKVAFFPLTAADLKGKYEGETQKNIKLAFDCAKEILKNPNYTNSILFFDEFEELAADRSTTEDSSSTRAVPVLLQMMQGIESDPRVSVIAATNYADRIDRAIWRRFSSHVAIDLPDEIARNQIIRSKLAEAYNFPIDRIRKDELSIKYNEDKQSFSGGLYYDSLINTLGAYQYSLTSGYYTPDINAAINNLAKNTDSYSGGDLDNLMDAIVRKVALRALCIPEERGTIFYLPCSYRDERYYIFIDLKSAGVTKQNDITKLIDTIISKAKGIGFNIDRSPQSCQELGKIEANLAKIVTFSLQPEDLSNPERYIKPTISREAAKEFLKTPN
jgi:SpoVK/Ycf46/Vps4 family AAA+-type ATPase